MMIKSPLNLLESNTLRLVTNPIIIVMVNFFFPKSAFVQHPSQTVDTRTGQSTSAAATPVSVQG